MTATQTAEFTSAAADTSNKTSVESKVNEQYDTDASMAFYEYVMGGGGDDIHYGLFLTEEDGLKESSQNSVEALANMAVEAGTLKKGEDNGAVHCLDLGSGKGGASRWLAKEYGCNITAFNLGERQNAFNLERAKAAGIGHLVQTHLGSFNEPLPADWTDKFDMVWSQEAFCHCMDQKALMKEVSRVLKPGGVIVFSDIMQGDGGGDCTSFTGQNVVAQMASPQMYKEAMTGAGMTVLEHKELTSHLTPYFKCMLDAVKEGKDTMLNQGVTQERLDAYEDDLSTRFERVKQGHFAWDMFCAKN